MILTPLPSPHILLPLLQYNNINHTRRVITTKVLREAIPRTNLLIFELCLKGVRGVGGSQSKHFFITIFIFKKKYVSKKTREGKTKINNHSTHLDAESAIFACCHEYKSEPAVHFRKPLLFKQ